jgi:hypothetical protein
MSQCAGRLSHGIFCVATHWLPRRRPFAKLSHQFTAGEPACENRLPVRAVCRLREPGHASLIAAYQLLF